MKRFTFVALFLVIAAGMVCAQEVGEPDPFLLGEFAQQMLKEVSVDKFETEGFWRPHMSS